MSGLLLAVDIGTTGTKSCVFTPEGTALASEYREYGCSYPRPGWVEQDAETLVKAAYATTGAVMKKIGADAARVRAVSFSTQRTCSIFLDRDGNLVRPMISWLDNRPVDEVREIEAKLGGERFHAVTGLPLNTTWNLGKLMWLRNNEPQNWERMTRFCQLQDFILLRFGSDGHFTDAGAVGLTGMWDIRAFDWCDEILNAFSIDKSILPKAVVPGTRVGTISAAMEEKTGIPEGTAIVVGAGDQHSAIVGAGVVEKGRMSVSLGTGGLVGAYMEDFPSSLGTSSNILNHSIRGHFQLEGYQAGAAGVFTWFTEQVAKLEGAYAASSGASLYPLLDAVAAKAPPGSRGVLFLPYLASSCAPRWNPDARGCFLGLTFAHDRACLVRSVLEGITLEVRDILEAMYRFGANADIIRILGGPTKSPFWNQLQANIYNRPVQTLKMSDAAVVGAAVFAGVGSGLYSDVRQGVANLVKSDKVYEPESGVAETYDEMYSLFCAAYDGLAPKLFPAIAEFQRKGE